MAERPDSARRRAERVTEIAITKQEFVKQTADTSQLRRRDGP